MHKKDYGMKGDKNKVKFRYFNEEIHEGIGRAKKMGMKSKMRFQGFKKGTKSLGKLSSQEIRRFI